MAALILACVGVGLVHVGTHKPAAHPAASAVVTRSSAPPVAANPASTAAAATQHPPVVHTPSPSVSASAAAQLPPPDSGPATDPLVQHALEQAIPTDLPPSTEKELVALGRRVWTAEATGTGRDRWPGYFGQPTTARAAVYGRFRIQAAIARRDGADPDRVVVHLVWAGADPAGAFLEDRTALLHFHRNGDHAWTPVR